MTISDIKSHLTILQVIAHYGLKLDKNHRLCCPWHDDKTPSLQIYPKTNTWTCFSSNCNAGSGDQIDYVMKYEEITKHEALLKCKELIGGLTQDRDVHLERIAVLTKYYKNHLYKSGYSNIERARQYLESRGLDMVDLQIGYCSPHTVSHWPKSRIEWRKSVEKYGLKRFGDCVLFAMRNQAGQVVGIYGRHTNPPAGRAGNKKTGKHFYLSGAHQGLYPKWPERNTKRLILTESIIDAASLSAAVSTKTSLLQLENYGVVAMYGTKGFTKDHVAMLSALKDVEEVVLFMDGDEGGEAVIPELIQKIQAVNDRVMISKINPPLGEDANSVLVKYGKEKLQQLISERQVLFSSSIENSEHLGSTEKEQAATDPSTQLITTNADLLVYQSGMIQITVLGGIKITGLDKLRVTLKIETLHLQMPIRYALDLYNNKQVEHLSTQLTEQLEYAHTASRQLISDLTAALESWRTTQLESLQNRKEQQGYELTVAEHKAALQYLKHPDLIANTIADISASGVIGEQENALIAYLIYMSRKRAKPLHVMFLGKSGSGKTYLQEMISKLIPDEDKKNVTALSDQSLYYLGDQLQHRILIIEDIDGAENVMYIIREFQTKGWVSKTVVWKNPQGKMEPQDVFSQGPVCISSCTTREKVYEDNANRCFLLYIDISKEQDQRIMDYQKQLSAGLIKRQVQEQIRKLHQNIQRVLKPIHVLNPFATHIDLPQEVFRPRRSLQLLLGFIETVTFYHQYQRQVHTDSDTGGRYIESTAEDVAISFSLLKEVLFRKSDELSGACRTFLEQLKSEVPEGQSFSTQSIRKQLRMHPSKLKRYLMELQCYGYVKVEGGSKYRGYEYQITNYQEYHILRDSIDSRLEAIISQIKKLKRA